jgi:4-hydroxy-tetrahydrodipicolinate synthase
MSKQKKTLFRGVATALITPFTDARIDFDAFGALIDRQIEAGVAAPLVGGTTGESATLSDPEKVALYAYAAERIRGRIPLIAGVGCADTAHTIRMAGAACAAGADALLVVTPYYSRPSQAGLCAHYRAVADAAERPVIIYSVPGRTGVRVATETYIALAEHPNIVAVKEASSDMGDISLLIETCADRLDVYAGNDDLTVPILSLGGAGVISVLSNVLPAATVEVCRLWSEGKVRLASARYAKLRPLSRALFAETNPVPVKCALSLMGLCREEFRLPLVPPSTAVRERLSACLGDLKLL